MIRLLLQLPATPLASEQAHETVRSRVISYIAALNTVSYVELEQLVAFVTHHTVDETIAFFEHYYRGQWALSCDNTEESIAVVEEKGETLVSGKEKRNGKLVYEGTYKNRKYSGDGTLYVCNTNEKGEECAKRWVPATDSPLVGSFKEGKMEGMFNLYGEYLEKEELYSNGRRWMDSVTLDSQRRVTSTFSYWDDERCGPFMLFEAGFLTRRGELTNGEESDNTQVFLGPNICVEKSDPSTYYFLRTPGMKDSLAEYKPAGPFYNGEAVPLLSKRHALVNFLNSNGEWGHIRGGGDARLPVVLTKRLLEFYLEHIEDTFRMKKIDMMMNTVQQASSLLLFQTNTEVIATGKLVALLEQCKTVTRVVLDAVRLGNDASISLTHLSMTRICLRGVGECRR